MNNTIITFFLGEKLKMPEKQNDEPHSSTETYKQDDDPPLCTFQEITLQHKPLFDKYFNDLKTKISDYSFSTCFMWKTASNLKWTIICECLCVFSIRNNKVIASLSPIGTADNVKKASRKIEKMFQETPV